MIEFCTKRRMILSIVILGILTVLVLILEEVLTTDLLLNDVLAFSQNATRKISTHAPAPWIDANPVANNIAESLPDAKKRACWFYEGYTVVQECSFCSDFEVNSKTPAACTETGMKETLRCNTSGTVYRSCSRVLGLEKRRFWIFQSLILLSLVLSYGVVRFRWSQLERRTIKAIERRLAAGH